MKLILIPAVALLAGCTSMDKQYAAHLAAAQSIAQANALAAQEKVKQMGEIARTSQDPSAKTAAVMAMAFIQAPQAAIPAPPESQALKWAAVLMPTLTNLGMGFYNYRLGVTNSDNAAATTIAGYNTFSNMASSGYAAITGTASAGFAANTGVATAGFGAASNIAGMIQAPQPNVTLSGTGVIGSGSYSAPVTTTTTRNSNNTTRNCQGGGGAGGGGGGSGEISGAGAPGGSGGAANC